MFVKLLDYKIIKLLQVQNVCLCEQIKVLIKNNHCMHRKLVPSMVDYKRYNLSHIMALFDKNIYLKKMYTLHGEQ